MKELKPAQSLAEKVRSALIDEIAVGHLKPGDRIVQEQIAKSLGVSRFPIQQALVLLHSEGLLEEASGRGLIVSSLNAVRVRNTYEIRCALEELACTLAAQAIDSPKARARGELLISAGRRAVEGGSISKMVAADTRFHEFLYAISKNSLIANELNAHLAYTQRAMCEILQSEGVAKAIWDQHASILDSICRRDVSTAQALIRRHLMDASSGLVRHLKEVIA
jgi:DNA-binding GntR family transcriptional regulator